MLVNLALGVLAMAISVVVHTFGLIAVTHSISQVTSRVRVHGHRSRIIAMVTTAIGIFGVLFLQVAIWACFYLVLGTVDDLETALYFSAVTFSWATAISSRATNGAFSALWKGLSGS